MPFQQSVNLTPAYAQAGDFASNNPRAFVAAIEAMLVAGVGGATMGRFAWVDANGLVTNAGATVPTGFVHRQVGVAFLDTINTIYTPTNLIPAGFGMELLARGDVWAISTTAVTKNQKVFASLTTGQVATGAAGATITGFIETQFYATVACLAGELTILSLNQG